jgi:hypothetical protein
MGQASASASSTSGINSTGGNLTMNSPGIGLYIVIAVGLVLAAVVWIRRKK